MLDRLILSQGKGWKQCSCLAHRERWEAAYCGNGRAVPGEPQPGPCVSRGEVVSHGRTVLRAGLAPTALALGGEASLPPKLGDGASSVSRYQVPDTGEHQGCVCKLSGRVLFVRNSSRLSLEATPGVSVAMRSFAPPRETSGAANEEKEKRTFTSDFTIFSERERCCPGRGRRRDPREGSAAGSAARVAGARTGP